MSEIVDRIAKLTRAGDRFELHRFRMKSKVDSRNIDRFFRLKPRSSASHLAVPVCQINPVVEAIPRTTNLHLRMGGNESIEPDFANIRHVVAVGVGEIQDLSFRAGQYAISKCHQTVTKLQMGRVDRSLVHATVGVLVFEQHHLRQCRRVRIFGADRIVAVFDNEHTALVIEVNRNGIHDERFRGDQLDAKSGLNLEAVLRLFG